VTNDAQDFNFYKVKSVKKDKMFLPVQRSNVSINFATTAAYVVYGASKPGEGTITTIEIVNGGIFLSVPAAFLASGIATYLLF
jgi:hypothetical protein